MHNRFRSILALSILASTPLSLGCAAKVLSFEPSDAGTESSDTGTETSPNDATVPGTPATVEDAGPPAFCTGIASTATTFSADSGVPIACLTDIQATQLCTWLGSQFESVSSNPLPTGTGNAPAGYASGPGMGCSSGSPPAIGWTGLSAQNCVLNLRHSPCAATVGSLTTCITYFVSTRNTTTNPSGTCPDIAESCNAFTGAAACDLTVLWQQTQPESTNACLGALPIVPGEGACVDAG
jgi:hypothetical protein